jgi:hypothetical protein
MVRYDNAYSWQANPYLFYLGGGGGGGGWIRRQVWPFKVDPLSKKRQIIALSEQLTVHCYAAYLVTRTYILSVQKVSYSFYRSTTIFVLQMLSKLGFKCSSPGREET